MPFYVGTANVWTTWTTQVTCATTSTVWDAWNDCGQSNATTTSLFQAQTSQQVAPPPTEEQLARIAAERERLIEEQKIRLERREEALRRAKGLLLSYLTQTQREELVRDGGFSVIGGHTKRRYRINAEERPGNVEVFDRAGRRIHRLCAHDRRHGTPWPDQLLAQKFYLEHHEEEFLAVANQH
jgi:hypothetical protein